MVKGQESCDEIVVMSMEKVVKEETTVRMAKEISVSRRILHMEFFTILNEIVPYIISDNI